MEQSISSYWGGEGPPIMTTPDFLRKASHLHNSIEYLENSVSLHETI